jgi:regulator of sigma E protease
MQNFTELLSSAGYFVVALGVLIAVHEFGHFWVARKLGVKVLRFSIGFGRPLWRRTARSDGTEYVLAAIPLGGYVKMLDEREGEVPADQRHLAFNRQVLWKRSAIVAAGPLLNFAFAIAVFWALLVAGEAGDRTLVGEVTARSAAAEAGFAQGDEILQVGDRRTPTWESAVFALMAEALDGEDLPVRVRDAAGQESVRHLAGSALASLPESPAILSALGLSQARPLLPPVIGEVLPGGAAEAGGLLAGDRVIEADGEPVATWQAWVDLVRQHPERAIGVRVQRDEAELDLTITPRRQDEQGQSVGKIGAAVAVPDALFEGYRTVVRLGPLDALGEATAKTLDMSWLMLRVVGRMVTGQSSVNNLSGPISIAETAGKTAGYGLSAFLKFLAVVSISLGVLNLLPIPVLDGGHLLYFLIEGVKGSPLSERAQEQGMRIGIALLAGLMTLAFYVDISRLLG